MKFMGGGQTKIMGIVNVNDDSFYEASRSAGCEAFCRRVDYLLESGASIIDIGAVSSRPGAVAVSAAEEWERLAPVLREAARRYSGVSFSLDTFRSDIVLRAYELMGPFIVNDISAGAWDEQMVPLVGRLGLRYIAMHLQGTFATMHAAWFYEDVVSSVIEYFESFSRCAASCGVEDWILDPGFGFSKSAADNMRLLEALPRLKVLGRPILVGISHKRFTAGRLAELEALAAARGADILRSHL